MPLYPVDKTNQVGQALTNFGASYLGAQNQLRKDAVQEDQEAEALAMAREKLDLVKDEHTRAAFGRKRVGELYGAMQAGADIDPEMVSDVMGLLDPVDQYRLSQRLGDFEERQARNKFSQYAEQHRQGGMAAGPEGEPAPGSKRTPLDPALVDEVEAAVVAGKISADQGEHMLRKLSRDQVKRQQYTANREQAYTQALTMVSESGIMPAPEVPEMGPDGKPKPYGFQPDAYDEVMGILDQLDDAIPDDPKDWADHGALLRDLNMWLQPNVQEFVKQQLERARQADMLAAREQTLSQHAENPQSYGGNPSLMSLNEESPEAAKATLEGEAEAAKKGSGGFVPPAMDTLATKDEADKGILRTALGVVGSGPQMAQLNAGTKVLNAIGERDRPDMVSAVDWSDWPDDPGPDNAASKVGAFKKAQAILAELEGEKLTPQELMIKLADRLADEGIGLDDALVEALRSGKPPQASAQAKKLTEDGVNVAGRPNKPPYDNDIRRRGNL